jgi:pimeloyl-ACP methyl ester carboxylesterase
MQWTIGTYKMVNNIKNYILRSIFIVGMGCLASLSGCQAHEEPQANVSKAPDVMVTETRTFEVDGNRLSGLLDKPGNGDAHALIIIVHGYGQTNVVDENWYYDLRSRFASMGVASFVWDKPGNGASEGVFDPNQSVASSASEVVSAAAYLRQERVPGSDRIGLWGISRAGWIAPLALAQDPTLAFWISVSGVDANESFGYLLKSNWQLKGYDAQTIDRLLGEWRRGIELTAKGGSYADYLAATENFRRDPFVQYLSGDTISKDAFETLQTGAAEEPQRIDPETGLAIYIEGFDSLLASLDIPVLALFGEKDMSVDWQSTKKLYEDTIGQNPNAVLTIKTFPNANHNIHLSETGGFEEMIDMLGSHEMAQTYYSTMLEWLEGVIQE